MKYLSPSPMLDVAVSVLPTPPHSPLTGSSVVAHHKTAVAATVLDSLCSFYQQERYWVHHTRASLELALSKGIDARAIMYAAADAPSPASSTSTLCDSPPQHVVSVKPDPDAESTAAAAALLAPAQDADAAATAAAARASRWLRRKNKMCLRLDGIDSHPHRTKGWKRPQRPHRAPPSEPGARLLEMFSELVDARMESCQRISRMVQESAGRQQACYC